MTNNSIFDKILNEALKETKTSHLNEAKEAIEQYVMSFTKKPIYPPIDNWSTKPTKPCCGLVEMFASSKVQKQLLNASKDIIFIPEQVDDWIDAYVAVYVKLNIETTNVVFALKKDRLEKLQKGSYLIQLENNWYLMVGILDNGNPERGFGRAFTADDRLGALENLFKNKNRLYSRLDKLSRTDYWNDRDYGDDKDLTNLTDSLISFLQQNQMWETLLDLYDVAYGSMLNIYSEEKEAKRKAAATAAAKKKAEEQSYIDWVENGGPVYTRFGFAYKGAKAKPISAEKALDRIKNEKPWEFNWETINGEKTLVLQDYGENDWY